MYYKFTITIQKIFVLKPCNSCPSGMENGTCISCLFRRLANEIRNASVGCTFSSCIRIHNAKALLGSSAFSIKQNMYLHYMVVKIQSLLKKAIIWIICICSEITNLCKIMKNKISFLESRNYETSRNRSLGLRQVPKKKISGQKGHLKSDIPERLNQVVSDGEPLSEQD